MTHTHPPPPLNWSLPFQLCPFHEAKLPCFQRGKSQFLACISLLFCHLPFLSSNYLIYLLIFPASSVCLGEKSVSPLKARTEIFLSMDFPHCFPRNRCHSLYFGVISSLCSPSAGVPPALGSLGRSLDSRWTMSSRHI